MYGESHGRIQPHSRTAAATNIEKSSPITSDSCVCGVVSIG
jgi:hypothetical protein